MNHLLPLLVWGVFEAQYQLLHHPSPGVIERIAVALELGVGGAGDLVAKHLGSTDVSSLIAACISL